MSELAAARLLLAQIRGYPHPARQLGMEIPYRSPNSLSCSHFDGIGENPRRLLGFVHISQATQRVNHPLSVLSHGHHQAFR